MKDCGRQEIGQWMDSDLISNVANPNDQADQESRDAFFRTSSTLAGFPEMTFVLLNL
jgi:hypothetical protein